MSQQSNQPATTEPTNHITTIITTNKTNNNNEANALCILCDHSSTLTLPIPIPRFVLRHAIPDSNPTDESTHLPRLPTVCQSCDRFPFEHKLRLICEYYEDKIKCYNDKANKLVKETRPSNLSKSQRMEIRNKVKENEDMAYYLGDEKKWALATAERMWEGASGQETALRLEEGKRDEEEAEEKEEVKPGEQAT